MTRCRTVVLVLAAAFLLATSGGCVVQMGQDGAGGTSPAPQETVLEWPPPPAVARVRYLRSVSAATEWGIPRGFLGRLADSFTGRREARLVRPTGVAVHAGVLYVADPGAQALFIFDLGRRTALEVHRLDGTMLVSPVAVAPGPDDAVFLVDSFLKQVLLVGRDGRLVRTVVGSGLARPAAVAYDASRQRLYVADSMAHRVHVYAPDGRALGAFGGNGLADGQFNSPTHLAVTRGGHLLVTDALNFRVQVFDPEGRFLRRIGDIGDGAGNFAAPKGVAADRLGRVYVADALFDAVQIFDDAGRLLLGFGEQGGAAGQFWLPNGLFIDDQEQLYVADAYNHRIQVFRLLQETTAAAPSGQP